MYNSLEEIGKLVKEMNQGQEPKINLDGLTEHMVTSSDLKELLLDIINRLDKIEKILTSPSDS